MENSHSNLGGVNAAPPVSDPELIQAAGDLPRMLQARFYFWAPLPAGLSEQIGLDPRTIRRLDAIDVVVTEVGDKHFGILVSSRNRTVLHRRDGVLADLQRLLQGADATIKIDRRSSHLQLEDPDIFLWLTVQQRDRDQLAPDLILDAVSGISGRDASARTADLRAGVDFSRPNFLTAVAEADTLGPIEIAFIQAIGAERRAFALKLHVDGGFTIQSSDIHLPDVMGTEEKMLTAALFLAFSLVPRINSLYVADAAAWSARRVEIINAAMDELEERYRRAKRALQERVQTAPKLTPDAIG
ncbi:hypothetical protein DEJ34_01965 [Curtobacterium sp. MCPF17_050]|uniref:hypothetical protein n=1 Tax=Curtobacterium sp. MCPF17_050 TaxID=2175664 RepID=UPI0011B51E6E|nr:hypothetical protein [Curtobacterium sp. MCPF17_050]WIB15919.1 hypothetical protein DEJ34_01965 [Curtobacterium sp. MCPF17_050]